MHAKQNSSKIFFRCFIHHSIENLTASKNICFISLFEALFHSKNRKIWKGMKKSIFRLFSIKLNFPSFMPTWIIQTAIFLFSIKNCIRKWPESHFRSKCLSAKIIESESTKIIQSILANFSQVFLEMLEPIFSHGSIR